MRAVGSEIVSRSGLFPQVSGTASYTRTLRSQYDGLFSSSSGSGSGSGVQDLPFGRTNQYSLGLALSQYIFDGGQTVARLRASRARRRSSEISVDAARAETLLDVTSSYFDALLSERLVTIAEASLAQQEEILRQTDRRLPGGGQIGVRAAPGPGLARQPAAAGAPEPQPAPGGLSAAQAAPQRAAGGRRPPHHRPWRNCRRASPLRRISRRTRGRRCARRRRR